MSEIEKLYELARVNRDCNTYSTYRECPFKTRQCEDCENFVYPPFTAEKQIELLKLLLECGLECNTCRAGKDVEYAFYIGYEHSSGGFKEFTEALAGIINNLWQDLSEEEKQQVKGILC